MCEVHVKRPGKVVRAASIPPNRLWAGLKARQTVSAQHVFI